MNEMKTKLILIDFVGMKRMNEKSNCAAIVGRPPTTHQPSITFSFIQKQKVVFDLLNCELMKLIEWLPAHTSIPSLILI